MSLQLPHWLVEAAKGTMLRAGFDLQRLYTGSSMDAALARASGSFNISTVIDVGASDGRWSVKARRRFPAADFVLIEAQAAAHEEALQRHAQRYPRTHLILAAAGHRVGTITFDVADPFGGAATEQAIGGSAAELPMTTIDAEIGRLGLAGPYLVKLDTHGFEREILLGAQETLARSALLIIEAYNFELRPGVLRFHELCFLLEAAGFRVLDLVDVMRRPTDGVLWQFDLVFAPTNRPEYASADYLATTEDL